MGGDYFGEGRGVADYFEIWDEFQVAILPAGKKFFQNWDQGIG
jgi:hypothetical protein